MSRFSAVRRGQSLVEFAVVALVMYMLLAGILTFGHLLYVAQGLQSAADLGAREIARTALPVMGDADYLTFEEALQRDEVRIRIYDDAYLVINLTTFYSENPGGNVFTDIVPSLPILNQQLVPLMIVDRQGIDGDGQGVTLLRYPGALLSRSPPEPPEGRTYENWVVADRTVGIPLVTGRSDSGVETIRWVSVVEEIESEANPDPFRVDSDHRGIVALRINYPFQSATMSSFRPNPVDPFEENIGQPNVADDGNVTGGRPVRPFRRVISAQAIYRRELFSGPSSPDT